MKRGLTEVCYGFFSTLANPTRLAILEKLRDGPMNVTGLADSLRQEQSMVSHNLRPLEYCAFVYSERRGKEKIYTLNQETIGALFDVLESHAKRFCPFGGECPKSH